ncbi:MAG: hypothetical protein WBO57_03435 [Gammaproteobacteria bacterium]
MMDNRTHWVQRLLRILMTGLIALALVLPGPSRADAANDMFGFMFRMMLTMMNVMSSAASNDAGGFGGWPGGGYGLSPWNAGWSGIQNPAVNPGVYTQPFMGTPYGFPYSGKGWYGPGGRAPFPLNNYAQRASLLDGTWYGSSGEILTIRGNRFRLRNGVIVLNGRITLRNNLLTLYTPQTNSTQIYTFARNLTDLVLQDRQGKILTFRMYPGRNR